MKLKSVRIENFRCFKDQTINFDDYTCFVGPNGAGKSTIFSALNVFFRQYKDSKTDLSKLSIDDFHHKEPGQPIKITVTFCELSKEAQEDLSDYVRQETLIVSSVARYDSCNERAEVKQYGNRVGFEDFRGYFEADKRGAKATDLKDIYKNLQDKYPDLPKAATKQDMADSLRDYEAKHNEGCVLIPSEDEFYGMTKGANRLAKYIQWVFVPASKDATEESEESKTSALGQLLARTVRGKINFTEKINEIKKEAQNQYEAIIQSEQAALNDISNSLEGRLRSWAHPNITAQVLWKQDVEKCVRVEEPLASIKIGERGFEGDLSRFGHGLQRSYLLALLQELTVVDDKSAPTLIMAIEEPELYQHPPQARYLAETLHDLSSSASQVMVCSHSPLFIPGDNFEKVRVVRERGAPSVSFVTCLQYLELSEALGSVGQKLLKEAGMLAKLYPSLNPVINEMFFCRILFLVEGIEDVAYITSYLMLSGKMNSFRRFGCHLIPAGGKSEIIKPLAMANLLDIPTYVVFDGDTDKEEIEDENRRSSEVERHKKDNRAILNLLGHACLSEWPTADTSEGNFSMWKTNLTKVIEGDIGERWKTYQEKAANHYGKAWGLKKNPLAVAKALELAWADGVKADSLISLVDRLIKFVENLKAYDEAAA